MLGLAVVVVALVFVLWVVLPDSPWLVALLGLVVIAAGGLGLWRILSLPQFSRTPDRRSDDRTG